MENSFKLNDTTVVNNVISPVSDEECSEISNDLLSQFDQITVSQIKEIEVKKIENEIDVKRLEKEYHDKQKGLAYSTKKLNEFRKEHSSSTDSMKRSIQAGQFFMEKLHELKKYNEVVLDTVDNAEKKSAEGKKNIAELKMTFQALINRDDHLNSSKEKLRCRMSEVYKNTVAQIEQKEEEYNKGREKLMKLQSSIEEFKKELNQLISRTNLHGLIEKKGRRMIELEAATGKLQKQSKQELDSLMQEKNKLIEEKTNNSKSIQDNDKLICSLQSEVTASEKYKSDSKKKVEQVKLKAENLLKQVTKEREIVELSKSALVEKDTDNRSELTKIEERKQTLIHNFTIVEDSMQAEIKKLYQDLEQKKAMAQKLENRQKIIWKLNEKKLLFQKTNEALEDKLKKAMNDLKKHEEIRSNLNKKKKNLELKNEELEQEYAQKNEKYETSVKEIEKKLGSKQPETPANLNTLKNEVTIKKVQTLPKEIDKLSIYKLSDSDESEDEFKIKDQGPIKSKLELTPFTQKTSISQSDAKEQSTSNAAFNLSENEIFDNMIKKFSQERTGAKTDDATDVFKLPQPFTQYKRRTPQPKKKN